MRVSGSWVEVAACCGALAGCAGHSLDIGSNDAGSTGATDSAPSLILGPAPDASGVTKQVWLGHLVDQHFSDGSDALTMTIDFAPGGQVTGSLLLGDGALLRPPTDPNVGYPPGNQGVVTLVEGFPYTILDGRLNGSHLTFDVSEYEVWTGWCALQTAYLVWQGSDSGPPDVYECLPPGPDGGAVGAGPMGCEIATVDAAATPIDCGWLKLCGGFAGFGVCRCSATGCLVFSPQSPGPSLDLVLAGAKADGTMSGQVGDYNVQFTRSQ